MVKTEEEKAEQEVKKALHTGEGWDEFDDMLSKITVKCTVQPLSEPKDPEVPLRTYTVLDDILGGGGLTAGKTVELYGEYGSGKSQTLFTLAVEAAERGLVIFIDVEDTFSRKRIREIASARGKNADEINNHIWLYSPETWLEQIAVPSQLPEELPERISLIVLDSLMALFRSTPEFGGRANLGKRQELLRYHLRQLKRLAKKHGAIVVFSNQVYDKPVANPFMPAWATQEAAGGHSVWHIGDFRVFLRKARGNVRIARLVDSSEIAPAERAFQLNAKGIDDLSDEQQKEALKKLQKWEEEQMKGEFTKKKGKKQETEDLAGEAMEKAPEESTVAE